MANNGYHPSRAHARSRYADIPVQGESSTPNGENAQEAFAAGPIANNTPIDANVIYEAEVDAPQTEPETTSARRRPSTLSADEIRRRNARTRKNQRIARTQKDRPSAATNGNPVVAWLSEFAVSYRRQLTIIAAVLGVFFVIGLLDFGVNWGKIYSGVHVGEVDVSGMTVEEASASIDRYYSARLKSKEVSIYADQATFEKAKAGQQIENPEESEYLSAEEAAKQRKVWTTNSTALDARVYPDELAKQALQVGRENGGIGARVSAQTFGWNIDPAIEMNSKAIDKLGRSIDRAIGNPHVDCDINLTDGVAVVTSGHAGIEVDRDVLRAQILEQFLGTAVEDGFVAVAEDAPIRIDQATAQAVADRINAGIAYGATLKFEGALWEAGTYDLASLIVTKKKHNDDGTWELVASYNASDAKAAILEHLQSTYNKQNISVQFIKSDDSIMVQTDATGTMPEVAKALEALEQQTLLSAPSDTPVIEVAGTQIPATMSIEAAMDYGLITVISEYETEYTGGATNRNTNIHLAADLLNNSIVKANGGTWSFNEVAGECNEEKGFKGAGVIVGGEFTDDVGGGICQVATTVFNAVYEAGLPIDERSNHSLYIASYPSGRDAAISWPDPDLVWHNDTNCDILLQTSWTDETITVTLLGVDPGYSVETVEGEFKDGEKHSVRTVENDDLEQGETQVKQGGVDGSSIDVIRTVRDANGNIVRKDTFTSVYDAQDEIIEVGPNTDIDVSSHSESDEDEDDEQDEDDELADEDGVSESDEEYE
ncbi:MAG: VanW family protein [Coriobacteriia bacterium]|nr:VanW family protein [Coriobacteriia bacterium]